MSDTKNKFNSEAGYDLQVDTAKISIDFDTNVGNPVNTVLGHNGTQFILVDQNLLDSTNATLTNDLSGDDGTRKGTVKTYVFEKLVDPSVVGCSNCDSNTDVYNNFIIGGALPIINREIIAEFEIEPEAYHSLEIDLVGHRRVGVDGIGSYNSYIDSATPKAVTTPSDLHISGDATTGFPPYRSLNPDILEANHPFLDYSCCPCCDAIESGDPAAETICNNSSQYFITPATTYYDYCAVTTRKYLDSVRNRIENITQCELLNRTKEKYGFLPNTTLPNCNI